jgi:hypothetical protein
MYAKIMCVEMGNISNTRDWIELFDPFFLPLPSGGGGK